MAIGWPHFLILNTIFYKNVQTWSSDPPAGIKFVANSRIYSFTTDTCPGGVFFKEPTIISKICSHGYFLRRPNGCRMAGSQIMGGRNYICEESPHIKLQAFIPLTNADAPLGHTISVYNDEDTLNNFRRYTYSVGLEQQYKPENLSDAAGLIVTNPRKTPKISLGNLCYHNLVSRRGASYMVNIPREIRSSVSNGFFVRKCHPRSLEFPWSKAKEFPFTEANIKLRATGREIKATHAGGRKLQDFEIWNGSALCLQTVTSGEFPIEMKGLRPDISSLSKFCLRSSSTLNKNERAPRRARSALGQLTKERALAILQKIQDGHRKKVLTRAVDGGKSLRNKALAPVQAMRAITSQDKKSKPVMKPMGRNAEAKDGDDDGLLPGDGLPVVELVHLQPGDLPPGFMFANVINCIKICLPRPRVVNPLPMIWTE